MRLTQERVLAGLLLIEIGLFCIVGRNFPTTENGLEIVRISVEIGLLALAMTPVIVSGGIDLSVGSLMGLSAVLFGKLWRDAGWPVGVAAGGTLLAGLLAGSLNAVLITRLRIPPLIVTLGSFSLFRGLAEGITGGVDNFTRFPESFLFLGQGYLPGGIPTQLLIFVPVAVGFWLLLHRTSIGRGLGAVGYSPEGARHAAIPVECYVGLVYVLSGFIASLAAIIYVAHLGQAKADAGTGYELMAITAVVLGGTSIFGGRGNIHGTLLGLFAIAVLQRGLRLADVPAELAGVLTGVLLLVTISADRLWTTASAPTRLLEKGEFDMKNSQVAALAAVILAAAAVVAGSNWAMVSSLRDTGARPNDPGNGTGTTNPAARTITIAMMPKQKGNPYFKACQKGADEAAKELGINLLWDGPTETDPAKQNEVIEAWITRGVDVIAVAAENREGISSVLRKARQRGIKVVTWDADAEEDARDFLVNQATPQGLGYALMDEAARVLGGKGEFAIITASLTAANQIEWQKHIEERRQTKYPEIKMAALRPSDDQQKKAFDEANTILNKYPDVKVIMGICSPSVPGAAEAVKQSGRKDVKVIGLSLPGMNKPYVHEGLTECVILWNTQDLGYLAVHAAYALKQGTLRPGDKSMQAGRMRNLEIKGTEIILGEPLRFTKENIDKFDF